MFVQCNYCGRLLFEYVAKASKAGTTSEAYSVPITCTGIVMLPSESTQLVKVACLNAPSPPANRIWAAIYSYCNAWTILTLAACLAGNTLARSAITIANTMANKIPTNGKLNCMLEVMVVLTRATRE